MTTTEMANAAMEQRMRMLARAIRQSLNTTLELQVQRNELIAIMIARGYTTVRLAELADVTQPRVVQINNVETGGYANRSASPRGGANQAGAWRDVEHDGVDLSEGYGYDGYDSEGSDTPP